MCSSRLAVIVAALVVAACGQLPRPFAHDTGEATMPAPLRPADGAGVVVDATRCSAALGGAIIAALHGIDVPASAVGGNLGSLWLTCHAVSGHAFGWTLSAADGTTLGEFQQAAAATDDHGAIEPVAEDVAARVLALLGRDVSPPVAAFRPALVIAPIAGAPGNGADALARAMAGALEWRGADLAAEPDDRALLVLGTVVVSDAAPGVQRVEVVWEVLRPDGRRLGVVNQSNTVPAGALDGEWGALAEAIADGGAIGVLDLLDQSGF